MCVEEGGEPQSGFFVFQGVFDEEVGGSVVDVADGSGVGGDFFQG